MANPTSVNSSSTNDTTVKTVQQWQRLSPIAIVYFGASFIFNLVSQIVYLIPVIVFGYDYIKSNPSISIPIAIAAILVILTSALLSFYFFQYRLGKNSIEIRSGVFSKKHINLPFSRIQNVKIEQPIYYRITDYACLILDTAGSNKQEAKVVALPLHFAEQLKKEIMTQHREQGFQTTDETSSIDELNSLPKEDEYHEQVLNTRAIKDLVIHGITSNRIWIFLGILAPFYEKLSGYIQQAFQTIGIDLAKLFDPTTHSIWQLGLYAVSMTMMIMLVLVIFSIIGSLITFYGFTLNKVDDRYIRKSGLFTKHEVSMRHSRLQKIAHKRDWLDMLLGRVNLLFEQSNTQLKGAEGGNVSALSDKIMVPSVTPKEAQELINDVYPNQQFEHTTFNSISKRFLVRYLGFLGAPVYIVLSAFFIATENYLALLPLSAVFLLLALLTFMRWKRWGYAWDEQFIYIRTGLIGIDHFVFPIHKIQQTIFKQSKFMKSKQLCTVKLVLASGAVNIPFIDQQHGAELINRCLYEVETSGKSWM